MSMSKELTTRIILRNDEKANWLDQELLKGEVGIEFDSNGKAKMKIGNGSTWDKTEYFGEEAAVAALEERIGAEEARAKAAEEALDTAIDGLLLTVAGKANEDDVYKKSETYTQSEIEAYVLGQIGSAGHLNRKIVTSLPTENIDVDTIYMVARESSEGNDVYIEYMYINEKWEVIGDTVVDLSGYAKSEDVASDISEVNAAVALKANAADVESALATKANASDLDALEEVVAGKANASDLEALEGEIAAIVNEQSGLLAQSKAYTDAQVEEVNRTLNGKVDSDTYNTAIENINTSITNITEIIGGSEEGGDSLVARISAVETTLEGKANKATTLAGYGITDAYTKGETYTRAEIADLISDITGGESAADVLAALNTYKGTNDARVAALEAVGAQANVLEAINFNGQEIAIVDKKATFSYEYTLPAAMADTLGGVKSSSAENQVAVDGNGIMEVNSLNVNKLVQTAGDTLILNGGSANL